MLPPGRTILGRAAEQALLTCGFGKAEGTRGTGFAWADQPFSPTNVHASGNRAIFHYLGQGSAEEIEAILGGYQKAIEVAFSPIQITMKIGRNPVNGRTMLILEVPSDDELEALARRFGVSLD